MPWTVAHQAPVFVEFFRHEYWSVLPFPPPRDLPNTGIKPTSLASPALRMDSLSLVSPGKPILLGGGGILGSRLGLYWHLLGQGREVQVPFPCFCWRLMEVLVTSGWYCKFGFPLSLLWYPWVGQGRASFTAKDRNPGSPLSLCCLLIGGFLDIFLSKWTSTGLTVYTIWHIHIYTIWHVSSPISTFWDCLFRYCSKMVLGYHSNILWCFKFPNAKLSLCVLT